MKYIDIRGHRMSYFEKGKGDPLLMCPSFLWDYMMWAPQIEVLSQSFRVIAVNLWEHGESDHLPNNISPYSLEMMADDYYELVKKLELKKFSLIGLSVGSMMGVHFALKYQDYLSSLILFDGNMEEEDPSKKTQYIALFEEIKKQGHFTNQLIEQLALVFLSPTTINERPQVYQEFERNLKSFDQSHVQGLYTLFEGIILKRRNVLSEMKNISIPTLVCAGEDDAATPVQKSKNIAKAIPNSSLQIIPKAGHIPSRENPDLCNEIITSFLHTNSI